MRLPLSRHAFKRWRPLKSGLSNPSSWTMVLATRLATLRAGLAHEFCPPGDAKVQLTPGIWGRGRQQGTSFFFIDSDVCIHGDTVSRLVSRFSADPSVAAIIGSYDDSPHEQDVLSMYRNLMHRYVHQNGRQEATTFWSGCGAIRRDLFLAFGGFDEGYGRPAIEDIELGYRLHSAGHKRFLGL